MNFTTNASEADMDKRKEELKRACDLATNELRNNQLKLIIEKNKNKTTIEYKKKNSNLQNKTNGILQRIKNLILNEDNVECLISNFKQNIVDTDELEIVDNIFFWYLFYNTNKNKFNDNVFNEFMDMYANIYKKQNILNGMIGIKNTEQFIFNMNNLLHRAILCRNIENIS